MREPFEYVLCTFPLVYSTSNPALVDNIVQYSFTNLAEVVRGLIYDTAFDTVREIALMILYSDEGIRLTVAFHLIIKFQNPGVFLSVGIDFCQLILVIELVIQGDVFLKKFSVIRWFHFVLIAGFICINDNLGALVPHVPLGRVEEEGYGTTPRSARMQPLTSGGSSLSSYNCTSPSNTRYTGEGPTPFLPIPKS